MTIIVDTNVIIDVITDDVHWADWSLGQLRKHDAQGLIINPVIFSELCFGFPSMGPVEELLKQYALIYREIPRLGLFKASKAFQLYRSRGGVKTFVLPGFFVGGHAEASGLPVLTRDTGRFETYFPSVPLLCPESLKKP